jgi:4-nitrophenyl phosphatase
MKYRGVILDLDGTVYTGSREVPGAGDFIRDCRARGIRCLFVTNRTNRLPETVAEHLRGYGIDCTVDDVLTASEATAALLPPCRAYVIGEEGLEIPLRKAGFTLTDQDPDCVIVGFDREFSYEKLKTACHWIGRGARFIATNPDRALRLEDRLYPGTGALVAAVEAGSNTRPLVIGKPERPIMDMALRRLGLPAGEVLAVGDNLATDIPSAAAAGISSVLMLTGVSRADDVASSPVAPTWVCATFAELETVVFGAGGA